MINGNAVGGIIGYGKTFIIEDENGNELVGTLVEEVTAFDADPVSDIRVGKKAVTDSGIVTGSAVIPNYETYMGTKIVANNKLFSLPLPDGYNYTKLQAIICTFNTNSTLSVSADKVVIDGKVLNVQSTEVLSSIVVNFKDKLIDFGITNTSGSMYLIRYFMYRELY